MRTTATDYKKRALEPIAAIHLRNYEEDAWLFEIWVKLCESPIEYLLAGSLFKTDLFGTTFEPMGVYEFSNELDWRQEPAERFRESRERKRTLIEVWPQASVGDYRVDFLILAGPRLSNGEIVSVVVECDGHDFHERTKEQAARDKSRDRALQTAGHRVFRFTGSEIYRKPDDCVDEIKSFIEGAVWDDEAFERLRRGETP